MESDPKAMITEQDSNTDKCVYKMIHTSLNLCSDVTKYCGDVAESIDFFKLRYCTFDSPPIFYFSLVTYSPFYKKILTSLQ